MEQDHYSIASQEGHTTIVQLLLAHKDGLDVNAANSNGITSLMIASHHANEEILKLLLENDGIKLMQ